MLPSREIDKLRTQEVERMVDETLVRLFEEVPPELDAFMEDFIMEWFAEKNGMKDVKKERLLLPYEGGPLPAMNAGTYGPAETRKMAQLQNLKGKLGQ
jgi:hypothetical protein